MKKGIAMYLRDNEQYRSDIRAAMLTADLSFLKNKCILITGATGLICSAVVDMLLENNAVSGADTRVYACARDKEKVKRRFGNVPNLTWIKYDAMRTPEIAVHADYVIHGASNASPELFVRQAVETMVMNFDGLRDLMEYASREHSRVMYLSSSEIYGIKRTEGPFSENDIGRVEHLNPRASYAMSKRAAETLCACYASEYGVDSVIVRPGHIFGPSASERDNRISSAFALKAARGETLCMNSPGLQKRSYMYSVDCAAAMLTVLGRGASGEAYNICGEDITSIHEMAAVLAEAGGVTLISREPTTEELHAFNPMNNSALAFDKLSGLGYRQTFTAKEGLYHTVNILRAL